MKLPPLYRLPGLSGHCTAEVFVDGTNLQVPDLDAAGVNEVWRSMEAAASVWRQWKLAERLDSIAEVARCLRIRGPAEWRDVLRRSSGLSAEGLDAAWETTFAPVTRSALNELLMAEHLGDEAMRTLATEGRLPQRIVHVLAGNVFPPTFSMMLRAWLLGCAQWLRPSTREPLFACCILEELRRLQPQLAACTAVLWWPRDVSGTERAVLASSDVITVQGDDAAVREVYAKSRALAPGALFVGYGSRWSAAVVSRQAPVAQTTSALARDIALFDQQGCLSPTLILVQRRADLLPWCAALTEALAALETRMPRGALSPPAEASIRRWREDMRLGVALGEVERFWESPMSTAWGVALMRRCEYRETPLDRHVVVAPFADAHEIHASLESRIGQLQGLALALAGWSADEQETLRRLLRPTRIAALGELQLAPPSWPQDHRSPLRSLLAAIK